MGQTEYEKKTKKQKTNKKQTKQNKTKTDELRKLEFFLVFQ